MVLKVVSAIALTVGLVVLIVLVVFGGVIKKGIHDEIMGRFKYKIPDGYKTNKQYEVCFAYCVCFSYNFK
jgi:hypothetical protein